MNEGAAIRALDINDLPVEVLCCIISMIPFKEAVRTSVLSKRWKYLFSLIPNLDIEMDIKNIGEEEMKRWMNFVDRLVLFREMTSIRRFCLRSRPILDPQRLDKWICALVRHKIQQLDLRTLLRWVDRFLLPANVKSLVEAFIDSSSSSWHGCASDILKGIQNIQTLRIKNCLLQDLLYYTIRIPKFSKLTCLEVSYGELKPDSDALDYFLTWCDVLESLELHLREKFHDGELMR